MAHYRVGVIGCGRIGIRHASGISGLENAAVVACCNLLPDVAKVFQERWHDEYPDIRAYDDPREMLAKEDLDVVTVATSDHRHADPVVDAADGGAQGIFCEKPLATSIEDADRMIDAVERNDTILSIDHTRRWTPIWRRTKQVVDEGAIGPVQYVIGTLGGLVRRDHRQTTYPASLSQDPYRSCKSRISDSVRAVRQIPDAPLSREI